MNMLNIPAPGDYDAVFSPMSITAGNTEQMISIPIKADNITENAESFMVELSNPSEGGMIINSLATVSIIDLDGNVQLE